MEEGSLSPVESLCPCSRAGSAASGLRGALGAARPACTLLGSCLSPWGSPLSLLFSPCPCLPAQALLRPWATSCFFIHPSSCSAVLAVPLALDSSTTAAFCRTCPAISHPGLEPQTSVFLVLPLPCCLSQTL